MILILFILYCLELFGVAKGQSRLIGGSQVPPDSAQFHASLQNLTGYHVCGGAIVSHRHAVTAAHCVIGAEPTYIKAVVGTIDLSVGGIVNDVKSIFIHPGYNTSDRIHDIAVIEVAKLFDLQHAKAIRMDKRPLLEGDQVVLTGFGAIEANGNSSTKMHYLTAPVFNQDTCKYAMRYATRTVADTMFCTFTKIGEGTCHGDSGGPVIRDDKLVGLISWGIPCATGYPDVHTRIDVYIDWIKDITDKSNP